MWSSPRSISTHLLNGSLHLHIVPINLVVYKGSYLIESVGYLIFRFCFKIPYYFLRHLTDLYLFPIICKNSLVVLCPTARTFIFFHDHLSAFRMPVPNLSLPASLLLLNKYYDIVTILLSADTNTFQIRRTKLCV